MTTRCMTCKHLVAVKKVKGYESYPLKGQEHRMEPASAVLVRGDLACSHHCAFISTWRQLQPHVSPIGAGR